MTFDDLKSKMFIFLSLSEREIKLPSNLHSNFIGPYFKIQFAITLRASFTWCDINWIFHQDSFLLELYEAETG